MFIMINACEVVCVIKPSNLLVTACVYSVACSGDLHVDHRATMCFLFQTDPITCVCTFFFRMVSGLFALSFRFYQRVGWRVWCLVHMEVSNVESSALFPFCVLFCVCVSRELSKQSFVISVVHQGKLHPSVDVDTPALKLNQVLWRADSYGVYRSIQCSADIFFVCALLFLKSATELFPLFCVRSLCCSSMKTLVDWCKKGLYLDFPDFVNPRSEHV